MTKSTSNNMGCVKAEVGGIVNATDISDGELPYSWNANDIM